MYFLIEWEGRTENAFAVLILIGCRDVKQLRLANENLRIPEDSVSMPKLREFVLAHFVVL